MKILAYNANVYEGDFGVIGKLLPRDQEVTGLSSRNSLVEMSGKMIIYYRFLWFDLSPYPAHSRHFNRPGCLCILLMYLNSIR